MKTLIGTNGYVWLNNKLLANLKSIELKVTGSFEETNICGEWGTENIYTGYSGEGTITCIKVDSTILNLLGDAYKTGVMPEIKIISKLTDQSTGKSERASVTGVVITEFFLAKFESKTICEEEIPIKFSSYEKIETI